MSVGFSGMRGVYTVHDEEKTLSTESRRPCWDGWRGCSRAKGFKRVTQSL